MTKKIIVAIPDQVSGAKKGVWIKVTKAIWKCESAQAPRSTLHLWVSNRL